MVRPKKSETSPPQKLLTLLKDVTKYYENVGVFSDRQHKRFAKHLWFSPVELLSCVEHPANRTGEWSPKFHEHRLPAVTLPQVHNLAHSRESRAKARAALSRRARNNAIALERTGKVQLGYTSRTGDLNLGHQASFLLVFRLLPDQVTVDACGEIRRLAEAWRESTSPESARLLTEYETPVGTYLDEFVVLKSEHQTRRARLPGKTRVSRSGRTMDRSP